MSTIARAVAVVGSLYGLLRNRLGLSVATPLGAQELSATIAPDRRLVVLGHEPIAGFTRDHGTVADEAAMLALHTLDCATLLAEPTFVAPGDSCLRTDDPGWRWHCIAGNGTALADWERRPLAAALDGKQAASANLTALASIASTTAGRNLLTVATPSGPKLVQVNADGSTSLVDASSGGGSGSSWTEIADADVPATEIEFPVVWGSNGDANGLLYLLGTNFGASEWTNPHNSGAVVVTRSSGWSGDTYQLVDRSSSGQEFFSAPALGGWFAVDLKAAVALTDYSLKSDSEDGYKPRNWKFQGSNNVGSNTTDGIEAATWVDLDVRTNDSTIPTGASTWGHFVLTPTPAAYRWYRVILTGVESSGSYYLAVVECELYCGTYTQLTARVRPSGSRCWLTDGEHYVPAW